MYSRSQTLALRATMGAALVLALVGWPQAILADRTPPDAPTQTVRGTIVLEDGEAPPPGQPVPLQTSGGEIVRLDGDHIIHAVLRDPQLADRLWEAVGKRQPDGVLRAEKLFTIKDGKRFRVTYYCEVCHITTYEPGRCMCCQDPTELREVPATE